jgi:hypothetical protein
VGRVVGEGDENLGCVGRSPRSGTDGVGRLVGVDVGALLVGVLVDHSSNVGTVVTGFVGTRVCNFVGALLVGVLVDHSSNVGTVVAGFVGTRVGNFVSSLVGIFVGNTPFPNGKSVGVGVGCIVGVNEGAFVTTDGDCVGLGGGD